MVQQTVVLQLAAMVKELRKIDPEMGLQMLDTFLCVAKDEGIAVLEVAKRTNQSASATSRNVKICSKWRRPKVEGYDLLRADYDAYEQRRKVITVTPKGRALIKKLSSIQQRVGD